MKRIFRLCKTKQIYLLLFRVLEESSKNITKMVFRKKLKYAVSFQKSSGPSGTPKISSIVLDGCYKEGPFH